MHPSTNGIDFVEAGEVRQRALRVAVTPVPSLLSVLVDVVGAGRNGTPEPWRAAVRAHLTTRDHQTLAPFDTGARSLVPDPLIGSAAPPGESLRDGVERILATPVDLLFDELAVCSSAPEGAAWHSVERDPGRWLRRYAAALLRAWKGFRPIWRHARAALDREIERIGIATALNAQLELLDGLSSFTRVRKGRWCIECRFATGPKSLPQEGLVLMPLVSGAGGAIYASTPTTIACVGYPLRGVEDLAVAEPPVAALEGLLGAPRAQILQALERPRTIGRLAEGLRAVPSAATHHVGALEAAGLVARERRGRNVVVQRTGRGEALLEVYGTAGEAGPFPTRPRLSAVSRAWGVAS